MKLRIGTTVPPHDVVTSMMVRIARALAALVFFAALVPAAVLANTGATETYDLHTRLTDVLSAGEYDGRLRIRITPDGIVGGSFMDTEGRISDVTGGREGTKIWLDLGFASPGQRHFDGTLIDGKLEAGATRGLHTWSLEGTASVH